MKQYQSSFSPINTIHIHNIFPLVSILIIILIATTIITLHLHILYPIVPIIPFITHPTLSTPMHPNQQLRLLQQICSLLTLPQPAITTTLNFYTQYTIAMQQHQHQNLYPNQVIVCACVFLAAKVYERQTKIRDILNAIYTVIQVYQLARGHGHGQGNYIDVGPVMQELGTEATMARIQPKYQLTMYNQLKKQTLDCEQLLLKILKFDFDIAEVKSSNFKQLLGVCDQLRCSLVHRGIVQACVNVYDDLEFCGDVVQWVPGIVYFGVQLGRVAGREQREGSEGSEGRGQQGRRQQRRGQQGQEESEREVQVIEQIKAEQPQQPEIPWQKLFLVPLRKLQIYSQKVLDYYQRLTLQQSQPQQ